MKTNRKSILALILVIVLALAALLLWQQTRPAAETGEKTIAVAVTHKDGSSLCYDITTENDTLYDALRQEGIADEAADGLITTVDGETADSANEEWWCFTSGGEMLNVGAMEQVIADGESYEITFTVGYDF